MVVITYLIEHTPNERGQHSEADPRRIEGVVFSDDSEVYDLLCRKRD